MVHIGLEGGQRVAESEEHDGWLKEPKRGGKGHLPSVFWADEDIVVPPSDIEFCEDFAVFQPIYQLRDEGEGVGIFDGVRV